MPMLTTATTDTVWATPDTATDTDTAWATLDTAATATATDTAADTATTARGLLMPSLLLSPRLMLTTATTDAAWDTPDTDTTTARFPNCLPNNKSKQFYIKIFH